MARQHSFNNRLVDGLLKVYDAAYSKDGWTGAMEACRVATQAAHTLYYAYGEFDKITFSAEGGSPTLEPFVQVFRDYNRKFREPGVTGYDDVGSKFMSNSPIGMPVKDTDIWDMNWISEREEVKFVKDRTGVFRRLYINVSDDPLLNAGVHFWYNDTHAHIPKEDLATVAVLGPHLAKALDIARWAESLRRKHKAVLTVLDKVELGISVTDGLGRAILSNTHAVEIYSEKDGIWCAYDGTLVTPYTELNGAIKKALEDIVRTSRGKNAVSAVEFSIPRRGSQNPLLMMISPLRDADMELERDLQGCLVTVVDTDRSSDLRLGAFGDAYGFTPMEKKAAELLVSGLTTPEVGEELGVAASTAKTHVKSILHKTRSTNRVSFVWRALQFSPPIQ